MHLITAHSGTEHITSANIGVENINSFGAGNYVFKGRHREFEASVFNRNTIRVFGGEGMMNGRHFEMVEAYKDVTINSGAQLSYRNDLICVRYTMDNVTGVESAELVVIEGQVRQDGPVDPVYNNTPITDGATVYDFPLYRVKVEGVLSVTLEKLFEAVGAVGDRVATAEAAAVGARDSAKAYANEAYGYSQTTLGYTQRAESAMTAAANSATVAGNAKDTAVRAADTTAEAYSYVSENFPKIKADAANVAEKSAEVNTKAAEVNTKAAEVAQNANDTKGYRDEAKKYRDEAYATIPEGHDELVQNVEGINDTLSEQIANGYLGYNIWDEQWQVGIITADTGNYISYNGDISSINFIKVKPDTTYYIASSAGILVKYYDSSKNVIGATWGGSGKNSTFKTTSNTAYIRFRTNDYGGTYKNDIAIVEGTSGHYVPYCPPNTEITTLNTNLLDLKMLGWSVPNGMTLKNSVSGNQFIQNVGRVKIRDLAWTYQSSKTSFYVRVSDMVNDNGELYLDGYVNNNSGAAYMANKEVSSFGTDILHEIRLKNTSYTTVDALISGEGDKYIYYKLATPITMTIDGNEAVSKVNASLSADKINGQAKYIIYRNRALNVVDNSKLFAGGIELDLSFKSDQYIPNNDYMVFFTNINASINKEDIELSTNLSGIRAVIKYNNEQYGYVIAIYNNSGSELPSGVSLRVYGTYHTSQGAINSIDEIKADLSDEWIAAKTYYAGDYCLCDNMLWKCKLQNVNQKPSESTYWTKTTVMAEFKPTATHYDPIPLNEGIQIGSGDIYKLGNMLSINVDVRIWSTEPDDIHTDLTTLFTIPFQFYSSQCICMVEDGQNKYLTPVIVEADGRVRAVLDSLNDFTVYGMIFCK